MIRPVHACLGVLVTVLLAACGDRHPAAGTAADPFPSTYRPAPATTVLIRGATVLTGLDSRLDNTDVLLSEGRIAAIGKGLAAGGTTVIEAGGRYLTPGIIDVHSHLGVYPAPAVWATSDGNEATAATTPEVWAEHSIWPQDPGFEAARAGGVTTLQVLPGSANLIGGRGVVIKNVPAVTYQQMLFPGARRSLKMACGENPKRVYGKGGGRSPSTGMGNVAGYRAAFAKASGYRARWDAWNKERKGPSPDRDLAMDTLADVLRGNILVHMHCYRADQMATMLDVAKEFGFKIQAFHHAVEAYKIAPRLAEEGVCAALWADWWGFKLEAWDAINENIAIVDAARSDHGAGCAIVHSDDPDGIQRLNQEAAKAMAAGRRAGLPVSEEHAIGWLTANPAKALGILDRTGTLEVGKAADVVLWSSTPFSVYAHADQVWIDGVLQLDRAHPKAQPDSDFMLGTEVDDAGPATDDAADDAAEAATGARP
ncbi:MAG: amidohydrolase [Gammaproteobacteria bacterium]|nr:amidohydrolase [Gammaproteobacteria bacterium]